MATNGAPGGDDSTNRAHWSVGMCNRFRRGLMVKLEDLTLGLEAIALMTQIICGGLLTPLSKE